ncbi:MAG: RluA family pseudouridine synthase [Clostridia bacterium]
MDEQFYIVEQEDSGKRLDNYASFCAEISRSYAKTLIDSGEIVVNGLAKKAGYTVKANDKISIQIPQAQEMNLLPQDIPINIVYEDSDLAVINKAQGMVVHPAQGSYENTLVNALLFHLETLSSINGVVRPGIVHRLDKDTSGLLVVAKNNATHASLQEQIATKTAKRFYIALVAGKVANDSGTIDTRMTRSTKDRKLMAVSHNMDDRQAITMYKVLQRFRGYTLMEYELKTGRTHQIRVHSKHIGHPIVGDLAYGGSDKFHLNGQLLHAFKLEFTHPTTQERMTFEAPLPEYFVKVLEGLPKE